MRSAAAAESVEILAQMHADEAASGFAPQMRGGGFAAQASPAILQCYYTVLYSATIYSAMHSATQCYVQCYAVLYIVLYTTPLYAGVAHALCGQLRRASSVSRPGCAPHDGCAARDGTARTRNAPLHDAGLLLLTTSESSDQRGLGMSACACSHVTGGERR